MHPKEYALEGSSYGGTGTLYPSLCLFVLPPLDLTQKEFQGQGCVVCL